MVKLDIAGAGHLVPTNKTTYKRGTVTESGSYRMDGPIHREKGKLYWQNMEVTGSQEQSKSDKSPKFSLLSYFRDTLFPILDDQARANGVKIFFQWDGAGPHKDAKLTSYLRTEFDKRGWIYQFQPAQSPITNINDACIFPSLSKTISSQQARGFEGKRRILKKDEIWNAVSAAWEELSLETVGRAFAGHAQVVSGLLHQKGDHSKFTRGVNNLNFGIRKTYCPTDNGVSLESPSDNGEEIMTMPTS